MNKLKESPHGSMKYDENNVMPTETQKSENMENETQTMEVPSASSEEIPDLKHIKEVMSKHGYNTEHIFRFIHHVNKFVTVKTINGDVYEGRIRCIDPWTGNMFLEHFDEKFTKITALTLIFNDGISTLDAVERSGVAVPSLYDTYESLPGTSGIQDRKEQLLAWIKKNRLPVKERKSDGALIVCKNVVVMPPYEVQNCSSPSIITLKNIRKLVQRLPQNPDDDAALYTKQEEDDSDDEDDEDYHDAAENYSKKSDFNTGGKTRYDDGAGCSKYEESEEDEEDDEEGDEGDEEDDEEGDEEDDEEDDDDEGNGDNEDE